MAGGGRPWAADKSWSGIDGTAPAARDQMRHSGFDGPATAGEVDVDHVGPSASLGDRASGPVADAGIGHDDVELAQLLDAAVDGGFQRVVVADVDLGGDDPVAEAPDQIGGPGQIVWSGSWNVPRCC